MVKKLLNLKIYVLLFSLFISVNATFYANSSEPINYVELIPDIEKELDADEDIVNALFGLDKLFKGIEINSNATSDFILRNDFFGSKIYKSDYYLTSGVSLTTPPVITLIGDNPQIIDACTLYVELGSSANDAEDGVITGDIVVDASAVDTSVVGSYMVTYNVNDSDNNSAIEVTRTVTVEDNTPPILVGVPADTTVECDAIPAAPAVTADDNCDTTLTIGYTETNNVTDGVGTITRQWTVTDDGTNTTTATQTITVEDNTPPILVGVPADTTVECDAIPAAPAVTADDNCDTTLTIGYTETNNVTDGIGTITRQWTVTDDGTNTTAATQTITVEDNTPPILVGVPADTTVECDAIPAAPAVTADDNCDTTLTVGYTETNNVTDGVGTITRQWTVTDDGTNTTTATQTITIEDNTPPILVGVPADTTVECDAIPAAPAVTADDNCDTTLTVGYTETNNVTDGVGTITRQWTVTDDGTNTTTATQTITIEDNTPPILVGVPADTTVECDAIPAAPAVTADDNCDTTLTVGYTETNNVTDGVGTITRQWTVTDDGTNTTTATQTITIEDNTPPILVGVPADTTVECDAIPAALAVTADDNCDTTLTVGYTETNNVTDGVGTITRQWTVTDDGTNTTTATQTITIEDNTPPILVGVPADTTVECDAIPAAPAVTADDNCDTTLTVGYTETNNVTDGVGTITRQWTVTDDGTNTTTATQTITIEDNTPPILVGVPADTTVECDAIPAAPAVTADDNCDTTLTVGYTETNNVTDGVGTITRQWTVTDDGTNTTTATQTITVEDNTPPILVGVPADTTVECDAIPAVPAVTADDNCDTTLTVGYTETNNVTDGVGTITRQWTVTGDGTNTTTATQTITVEDNTPPITPASLPDITAECSVTVTRPTTTDVCGGVIIGKTGRTNLIFDTVGEEVVYWIFTDASGNSTPPVEQKIIITDIAAPVPDEVTLSAVSMTGCQFLDFNELIVLTGIPTATDECDGLIQGTLSPSFVFPYSFSGTETIEWEFLDSNGNIAYQEQNITLNRPSINGGTIQGTYQSTVFSNQIDISSCGVAIDIDLNLGNDIGTIVQWEKFAVNHGAWEVISNTSDNYSVSFAIGALESTFYRVLVRVGSTCTEYSDEFYIRALPAGAAPEIKNLDLDKVYCLGDTVNLLATSNYVATEGLFPASSGQFNQGHLDEGWLVDDDVSFSAGGDSRKTQEWRGTNDHEFGEIYIDSEEFKFVIAQGDYFETDKKGNPVYDGNIPTTLETPVMDLTNAVTASLDFDQAYYFADGDIAIIEISINGGAPGTYSPLVVMHAAGSGVKKWYDVTNDIYSSNVKGASSSPTVYNFKDDNTSIPLPVGPGYENVKIRWSFTGTTNQSFWAMDNLLVNQEVIVDTELEWTDGIGDPDVDPIVIGGETQVPISFVPEAPGRHEYGATALINGCRTYDADGTDLIEINVTYANAGVNKVFANTECGQNIVQLNAFNNTISSTENNDIVEAINSTRPYPESDDPGTGEGGFWTISPDSSNSCGVGTLSDPTDPNAIFTGQAGTYVLTWSVNGCESDITIEIGNCNQVDFDGTDDYVDFGENNYELNNGAFSIEVWVKPESVSETHTIFSKRDANYSGNAKGYDLRIDNSGEISFNLDRTWTINSSPYKISTDRWYHIALTHSISGEYKLYIDGILINDPVGGGSPGTNNYKTILGAMDNSGSSNPLNYFNGWMDEFRIWDIALTEEQLHQMMNQKIIPSPDVAGKVQGEIIPIDIHDLSWANLKGYYQMESLDCGYLNSTKGSINGRLKNITSSLIQTAPIPYTSEQNGNWNTMSTWTQPNVWDAPNSLGVNGVPIDWNIVKISDDISSGLRNDNITTLLGLISDSGTLTMDGTTNMTSGTGTGQGLWVTHYLDLDGIIDLEGESQLIQKRYSTTQTNESILDTDSSGHIERDQQINGNLYDYVTMSSPVGLIGASQNTSYSLRNVLKDGRNSYGSDLTFTNNRDGDTNPITISNRWIKFFINDIRYVRENGDYLFNAGVGFIFKGSLTPAEANENMQNFVFKGKPHNGNIELPISNGNYYMVGNPYPSALDADQFILDNLDSTTGVLQFFEDWSTDDTHIEKTSRWGYGVYSLAGGVGITKAENLNVDGDFGINTPTRYIPVGQAFFVEGKGGMVKFKNNQRYFETESDPSKSIFYKGVSKKGVPLKGEEDKRLKLRIGFEFSNAKNRQLLLTIDERATELMDRGFDAEIYDYKDNDLYWLVEDKKLVIQALGTLTKESSIPIGLSIKEKGIVNIKVDNIDNPYENMEVYLRNNITKDTYNISNNEFEVELESGEYDDMYSIVFKPKFELSDIDVELANNLRAHLLDNELRIVRLSDIEISNVSLFNILGQQIMSWSRNLDKTEIILPINVEVGVYLVIVETEKGRYLKKVIKK